MKKINLIACVLTLLATCSIKSYSQDFFKSHNANRIEFTKTGKFKFTIHSLAQGSKSEYSFCIEISNGGTRPENPCKKNPSGTFSIDNVQRGNTLALLTKDCGTCPGGEANLVKRIWTDSSKTKAELTWETNAGFRIVVFVQQEAGGQWINID